MAPPALDAISVRSSAGQITGLVGPDGAGKTTLIRLMAGLLVAERGHVTVCGFDTSDRARPRSRRDRLHAAALRPLRRPDGAGEPDALCRSARRRRRASARSASSDLLAFTDLARFTERLAGKLSGGMKQKLGLACALLRSPRLLLLDEPERRRRSDLAARTVAHGACDLTARASASSGAPPISTRPSAATEVLCSTRAKLLYRRAARGD